MRYSASPACGEVSEQTTAYTLVTTWQQDLPFISVSEVAGALLLRDEWKSTLTGHNCFSPCFHGAMEPSQIWSNTAATLNQGRHEITASGVWGLWATGLSYCAQLLLLQSGAPWASQLLHQLTCTTLLKNSLTLILQLPGAPIRIRMP